MASNKKLILEYYTYPIEDNDLIQKNYNPDFFEYPKIYEYSFDYKEISDYKLREFVNSKILENKVLVKNLTENTTKLCCIKSSLIDDKKTHIETVILY